MATACPHDDAEHLFAAGYAACSAAVDFVASQHKVKIPTPSDLYGRSAARGRRFASRRR